MSGIVKKLALFAGLLIFFLALILYFQYDNGKNIDKALSVNETLEEYKDQIKQLGPEDAFKEFKNEPSQSHFLAHLFGEALFYVSGPDGVGACDESFEFGCYHGFFSAGIQDEGIGIISKFDEACRRKWGDRFMPCQHGIGHGLMSYGISLNEALEWCKKITWQPTGGCTSGVFMEYNFPALSDHTGTAPRKAGDKGYFYPCPEVGAEFRDGCYFELPQWWLSIFNGDFVKMGSLCGEVKNAENKQWCFHGIGNYAAPFTGFDISRTIAICKSLPGQGSGRWCQESAAWLFLARPESVSRVAELCDGSVECLDRLKQNPFYDN